MKTTILGLALVGLLLATACDDKKDTAQTTAASEPAASSPAPEATASAAPKATATATITKAIGLTFDAWNSHDAKKLGERYAADAKLTIPGTPDVVGRDAIVDFSQKIFTGFPDFKAAPTRTFVKDHTSVDQWVVTGTNKGDFMGQKATERPVGIEGVTVTTYDDAGLIKEEHRYYDMISLQEQLDPKAKAGTFRPVAQLPTAAADAHVAKTPPTPDDVKTLSEGNAIYAAFENKKTDDLLALFADDASVDDPTVPTVLTGKTAMKPMVDGYAKTFPDLTQTKPLQFAADGFLVSEGVLNGTQKGPIPTPTGTIKPSNKPVAIHFVDVILIKDGKAQKMWTYSNGLELMTEIGAIPAPGASGAAAPSGKPASTAAPTAKAAATSLPVAK